MAVYRRVYDSRQLQADCQELDWLRKPMLGNRVWATYTFLHWAVQCELVLQVCKLTECFGVLANVLSVIVTCFCHDCGVVMNHVWNVDANDCATFAITPHTRLLTHSQRIILHTHTHTPFNSHFPGLPG